MADANRGRSRRDGVGLGQRWWADMTTASLLQRSFVLCALLAASSTSLAGQNNLLFPIPPGWEVGYHAETKTALIIEIVRPGETVNNWSELLTLQQFASMKRPLSARQLYGELRTGGTVSGPDGVGTSR
jgi:hypothetical protein